MLEDMLGHIAPPKKDYAVYYLKHADCYAVKLNLEEFFQTEKKENSNDRMRRFWWDDDSSNKTDDTPKLSRRKPLRFIDDSQTNSDSRAGGHSRSASADRRADQHVRQPEAGQRPPLARARRSSTSRTTRPPSSPRSSRTRTATC